MKKALFFVAEKGFRDEEYFEPKQILEDEGIICEVTSTNSEIAEGSQGAMIMPTINLDNLTIDDFDAFILVGGPGALAMGKDFRVEQIINEAYQKNKLLGAICIAPVILAEYGLLKDKKATVFPSGKDKIKEYGATYVDEDVVMDNTSTIIITADGPDSAISFGKKILEFLQ